MLLHIFMEGVSRSFHTTRDQRVPSLLSVFSPLAVEFFWFVIFSTRRSDFVSGKMSRRPAADRWTVIMWHKEGLTIADICRKTGFKREFVSFRNLKILNVVTVWRTPSILGAQESVLSKWNELSRPKCGVNDAAQVA